MKIESDKSNMENVIRQADYPDTPPTVKSRSKLPPTVKTKSYADAVKKQPVRRKGILKMLNRQAHTFFLIQ